jgi:predicted permease
MHVLNIIFPILAIALVGYAAAFTKLLSPRDVKGLSRFVFKVAFPILLFNSFSKMDFPDQLDWKFLIAYYLVAIVVFFLGFLIKKSRFRGGQKDRVIFGIGSSFSNLVLVGLPILSAAFGDDAILPLFMIVSVQSAILFTLATILIESSKNNADISGTKYIGQIIAEIFKNPIILGILTGILFNLFKLPIPGPIAVSLEIFSKAALPCGLFMLGASLTEFKIQGQMAEAGIMVSLKMILQPFLVWFLVFPVLKLDPLWATVAVLAAGMPIGVNTFLFAQHNQADSSSLSAAILVASIFAIFSQTVMISFFLGL